jgi:ubiquinone/menaquinone biosynthesis C-methylase UbiE
VQNHKSSEEHTHHVCPLWVGYLLSSPIRTLYHNPEKILGHHVQEGMTTLDIGCAMGFFTLAMARMVGTSGKVMAVDVQEKMVEKLLKRAKKASLLNRIEARICLPHSLGLNNYHQKIDFALAFAVVHEVPDANHFFNEIYLALKPKGKLLLVEPKGHVTDTEFSTTLAVAGENSFIIKTSLPVYRSHTALLYKKELKTT